MKSMNASLHIDPVSRDRVEDAVKQAASTTSVKVAVLTMPITLWRTPKRLAALLRKDN